MLTKIILALVFIVAQSSYAKEAVGHKKFAVVLYDYANDSKQPSQETIKQGLFESEYSVARYIETASYGKTTFSGELFGWIKPDNELYGKGWTACWPDDKTRFTALLKHYPKINLLEYDGFIFYVHRQSSEKCAAGVANTYGLQERPTFTPFGKQPLGVIKTRIAYFSTSFYFPYQAYSKITNSTVAHELIHTFGISNHSNAYVCGDKVLSMNINDCKILAYGDIFSIMGLRSQASLPNSIDKERLGWLNKESIMTVAKPGIYKIYSASQRANRTKAIKLALTNPIPISEKLSITHLYIEYRGMDGFDERDDFFRKIKLADNTKQLIQNRHGALIYGADCGTYDYCLPYLLNMNPSSVNASYPNNQMANAYLRENNEFKVINNYLAISVERVKTGEFIEVKVSYNQ
ncbi:hypothetical protein [Aliikangiella sp. IMCC44359]|uniref:hypothetical protein n=1 Tax=Aliikangiella sp. IMCC44359 TaxID=3459125 RepID=UPI00403AF5CC